MPLEQNPATSVTATIAGTPNVAVTSLPAVTGTVNIVNALDAVTISGTSYTVKSAAYSATASGDNTILALVASKKLRILKITIHPDAAVNIAFKSGGGSTLISAGGFARGAVGFDMIPGYFCETVSGEALVMNLSTVANVRGVLVYIEV